MTCRFQVRLNHTLFEMTLRIVGILAILALEVHSQHVGQWEIILKLMVFPDEPAVTGCNQRAAVGDPFTNGSGPLRTQNLNLGQNKNFKLTKLVWLQPKLGNALNRPPRVGHRLQGSQHGAAEILRPLLTGQFLARWLAIEYGRTEDRFNPIQQRIYVAHVLPGFMSHLEPALRKALAIQPANYRCVAHDKCPGIL